jgi:hypothetical protein
LKPSYYAQALLNLAAVDGEQAEESEGTLFDEVGA